jgi:C4-dicarboxylate-specific signal transduction histidine kinase
VCKLRQVFMNLMLNAIEAVKDSVGELTVKAELQDDQLQLSVSDKGVGLPIEKMDRQRHGVGHQPFHCGVVWRAVVGKRQRRTR